MKRQAFVRLNVGLIASASICGFSCVALPAPALAQEVDVCTGVTLPRSEVTDIIGDVNGPMLGDIEGTLNGLLGIVDPLNLIPDLSVDLTTILANAAAGAPITLDVLDTNGNAVGPGDCNLTADGYTLNTERGIEIGGNTITGLGVNGQAASAAELNAIAFGNSASTSIGATGAVALGTGASATAANSVALGAGSVADRAAQAGYTAPGLAGTFNSAGSVSVGAAGSLRQLTNLAPGTAASDAATVGQVQGALAAIAGIDALSVQYVDVTQAEVALAGAGGTTISNLAPGALNGTSDEAVNGAQLFATNQNVATQTTQIATLATDLTGLIDAAVQYDDATHATVSFDGAGGTLLTNLSPGAINAGSDDAVNGAQLFATNQAVAANTSAIGTLQTDVAANTADIGTLQTDVAANTADIGALDVRVTATETDIAGLQADVGILQTDVAANTADIAVLRTDVDGLQTGVAANTAAIVSVQTDVAANTADIGVLQVDVAANTADIAALGASSVQYDDPSHASVTLDGAGGTTLANVAAATLDATSDEAVNGAQLFATNQAVATNTSDITNLDGRVTVNETSIANLDARTTVNEGDISTLDGRVTTHTTQIANLDARTTVNEGDITSLDGRVTTNTTEIANLDTSVTLIDARVTTAETDITTLQTQVANAPARYVSDADRTTPSATPTNTVALASQSGGTATLTNVAAGTLSAASTEAVNGAQLYATNQAVTQYAVQVLSIAGSAGAVQYSNPGTPTQANGGTMTNDVTLVGVNAAMPVALHNVGSATHANDAVNLGQMQAGLGDLMASSMAYSDQLFTQVAFDLDDTRKDAFAGTAAAMAVGAIPQTMTPGGRMLGGGVSHYRGQTAFALGASATFNGGRGVAKIGATLDVRGQGGVAMGAGFGF